MFFGRSSTLSFWSSFLSILHVELLPTIVPLGCFVDKKRNRLLRNKFAGFRSSFNSSDPHAAVIKCAHLARDTDYEYFAVQNFGNCFTDVNITTRYDQYGKAPAEKCVGEVGAAFTNFVYRLRPVVDGPNECNRTPCQNGAECDVPNDAEKCCCAQVWKCRS